MAEQVKISELERVAGKPGGKTLFEVDVPEDASSRSKSVSYKQLLEQIDAGVGMAASRFNVRKLSAELETPTLTATIDVDGFREVYVPSALGENTRGSLDGISCFNLCAEIGRFLAQNEVPYISAVNSPWAFASDVVGVSGDSTTKIASQKWVSDVKASCDALLCDTPSGDASAVYYMSPEQDAPISPRPVFNTKSRIYVCESTRDVNHAIVEINHASGYIFDTRYNSLSVCDDARLTEISDFSPMAEAGYGSLLRHKTNSAFKTFFTTPVGFVKVMEHGPTFRIVDRVLVGVDTYGFDVVNIPDDVSAIADEVFAGHGELTSVGIPSSVLSVGDYAFQNCAGLSSVDVNENAELGQGVFLGCRGMADENGFVEKNHVVFDYFGSGTYINTLPSGTTRIDAYAFWNNSDITGVVIPESVVSIGEGAFWRCTNLDTLSVGGNPVIGAQAFGECPGIADSGGFVCVNGRVVDYIGDHMSIRMPVGVSAINDAAFAYHDVVTNVQIQEGMYIGNEAFRGCRNLRKITLEGPLGRIGDRAFQDCSALTGNVNVWINNLGKIGVGAFNGCTGVNRIVVHTTSESNLSADIWTNDIEISTRVSSVVYTYGMSGAAKELCSVASNGNSDVLLENDVNTINNNALCGCSTISSVFIPDTVYTIGTNAFRDCSSLTEVRLPRYLQYFESSAFYGCSGLTGM